MDPKPQKSNLWLWIIFIIVVLVGGGYFGWYFWNKSKTTPTSTSSSSTTTPSTTTSSNSATVPSTSSTATPPTGVDPTAGWKTFSDTDLGFSIKYPTTWSAKKGTQEASAGFYDSANPIKGIGATSPNIGIAWFAPNISGENFYGKSAADQIADYTNADRYIKNIMKLTDDQITTSTDIIKGSTVYFYHNTEGNASLLFVQKDNKVNAGFYQIRVVQTIATTYNDLSSDEKGIISSFQFTQ